MWWWRNDPPERLSALDPVPLVVGRLDLKQLLVWLDDHD